MYRYRFGFMAAVLGAGLLLAPTIQAQTIERVSVHSDGSEANSHSDESAISADGRFVTFRSHAQNLITGDTNGWTDIFVHDRATGVTEVVSVASDGTLGNNTSYEPSISADGNLIAFRSVATNLVAGDNNFVYHVYVHDRSTGITELVSVSSDGVQANGNVNDPDISGDGRFVAFASYAFNLVTGDTNNVRDIFVHDRETGTTERISVASDGTQGNGLSVFNIGNGSSRAISADGRFIAFMSDADNLVAGDTNGWGDVFVHDRQTGITERVSVASDGTQGNRSSRFPSISGDGRYVAFSSFAYNLVAGDTNAVEDAFVHDRVTRTTTRISLSSDGTQGNGYSGSTSISDDGNRIAFSSGAFNLVADDFNGEQDVFLHDRLAGTTERLSVAADGSQGVNSSLLPSISADGTAVAFQSGVNVLVAGDTNATTDVFVHGPALDNPDLNTPPTVGPITAPLDPVQVNSTVAVSADFTDPDTGDSHTGVWSWGDGTTSAGTVSETNGSGTITGAHVYTTPGIYTVTVTVSDGDGGQGSSVFKYVVVFDPRGNFIVGGGTITSPLGAYSPDSSLTGRANFGFVSKFEKKATIPTGNTEFQFQVAGLNFHAQNYEWLVVAGARGQFKGTGTINGTGGYGFMLTAIDGDISGGGGIDKFRIKIWATIGGGVIYDNELGLVADDGDPTTALDGGSIMIKQKGAKTGGGGGGGGGGKGNGRKK